MKSILFTLLLTACGAAHEGDDPRPTGNLWRIEDPAGCAEREAFEIIATVSCSNTGQRPIVLGYGPDCLVWHLGIGGPYAIPGVQSMTFTCV